MYNLADRGSDWHRLPSPLLPRPPGRRGLLPPEPRGGDLRDGERDRGEPCDLLTVTLGAFLDRSVTKHLTDHG